MNLRLRATLAVCGAALLLTSCASSGGASAEAGGGGGGDAMPIPERAPLHPYLQRLVGDWEIRNDVEAPDGSMMVMEATESVEAVGPWIVSRMSMAGDDADFDARLMVTYDESKGAFVGTWVDSSSSYLWEYEGSVEGDTLTLEAEGPSYEDMSLTTRYRDIVTVVGDDRREHRSEMLMQDGTWVEMVTGTSTRTD